MSALSLSFPSVLFFSFEHLENVNHTKANVSLVHSLFVPSFLEQKIKLMIEVLCRKNSLTDALLCSWIFACLSQ